MSRSENPDPWPISGIIRGGVLRKFTVLADLALREDFIFAVYRPGIHVSTVSYVVRGVFAIDAQICSCLDE